MRQTLAYALLLSVPPGVAAGSGTYLLAGRPALGLAFGFAIGLVIFALVVLGSEYGSVDESQAER
jgi:tetrahydromethanopterin S-methyltransferase subunit B